MFTLGKPVSALLLVSVLVSACGKDADPAPETVRYTCPANGTKERPITITGTATRTESGWELLLDQFTEEQAAAFNHALNPATPSDGTLHASTFSFELEQVDGGLDQALDRNGCRRDQ